MDIAIRELQPGERDAAARVAARALRDNPSSIAMLPGRARRREKGLVTVYGILLHNASAPTLGAFQDERLVGIAFYAPPGTCYYSIQKERMQAIREGKRVSPFSPPMPISLLLRFLLLGPRAVMRISRLGKTGMRHDPDHPHTHVELVGVLPELQGQGIGTRLMQALHEHLDASPAFLETDTPENVAFYRRLGYDIVGQEEIADFTYWYMQRPA